MDYNFSKLCELIADRLYILPYFTYDFYMFSKFLCVFHSSLVDISDLGIHYSKVMIMDVVVLIRLGPRP